jgi:hypothetical protein
MVSLRHAAVAFFMALGLAGAAVQVHAEEELVTITATRTHESDGPVCEGMAVAEASRLAREAEKSGDWQRASDCFLAAGEYMRAHRASTRAASESAAAQKRNASAGAEVAKNQMARIRAAFR